MTVATVPLDLLVLTDLSGALAFWGVSFWGASSCGASRGSDRVGEGQSLHQSALRTLLCEIRGREVCRARGTMLSLLTFLYCLDVNKRNCAGTMEADPASWYAADPGNFCYAASASYPISFLLTLPRQTECEHQGVPTAEPTNFTRIGPSTRR